MPLYEYKCQDCETTFEMLVAASADSDSTPSCTACGSKKTKKLFSTFAARSDAAGPDFRGGCEMPGCGSPVPGGCGSGMCDL